ncbi:MAG: hypothetical protein JWQ09_5604 [Segetibacter sp.]|nr:hypothetical protein [Segetibacter sp.]
MTLISLHTIYVYEHTGKDEGSEIGENCGGVMCINNKTIWHLNGIQSTAEGLIEGEIYTVADETVHIHPNNKKECYLIAELDDLKLIKRFISVSEIDEAELVKSKEEEAT